MLTRKLKPTRVMMRFMPYALMFGAWAAIVVTGHTLAYHPERLGAAPGLLAKLAKTLEWGNVGIPFSAIAPSRWQAASVPESQALWHSAIGASSLVQAPPPAAFLVLAL